MDSGGGSGELLTADEVAAYLGVGVITILDCCDLRW